MDFFFIKSWLIKLSISNVREISGETSEHKNHVNQSDDFK